MSHEIPDDDDDGTRQHNDISANGISSCDLCGELHSDVLVCLCLCRFLPQNALNSNTSQQRRTEELIKQSKFPFPTRRSCSNNKYEKVESHTFARFFFFFLVFTPHGALRSTSKSTSIMAGRLLDNLFECALGVQGAFTS